MTRRHGLRLYVLDDDGEPMPVDDWQVWAAFFEQSARRSVATTRVGSYLVSTVFLGIDHNFRGDGPPVLWETMVFHDGHGSRDLDCRRYSSRQDALDGHAVTVALVEVELARVR